MKEGGDLKLLYVSMKALKLAVGEIGIWNMHDNKTADQTRKKDLQKQISFKQKDFSAFNIIF